MEKSVTEIDSASPLPGDVRIKGIREKSKSKLLIATGLIFIGAAVLFFVIRAFLIKEYLIGSLYEKDLPPAIARILFFALPFLYQSLEKKKRLSLAALPENVVSFERYLLSESVLFFYGVSFLYAASGLAISLIWLFGEITGIYFTRATPIVNIIILSLVSYYLGSWVGSRYTRRPFLILVGIIIGYSLLSMLTKVLFSASLQWPSFTISILLFFLLALFGLWRGNKHRQIKYIQYLLKFLPKSNWPSLAEHILSEVQTFRLKRD